MPAAVGALITIAVGVTAAVAAVAVAIASAIAGIVGAVAGAVGSVGSAVIGSLGALVEIALDIVLLPVHLIRGDLLVALDMIAKKIAFEAAFLSAALNSSIVKIVLPVTQIVSIVKKRGWTMVTELVEVIDPAATAILTPIKETLVTVKGAVDAIKEPIDLTASAAAQVRETISDIASLKIIDEMLKETTDVSKLIEPIANGKSVETAQAIATLSRGIVTTTVATMDKVDVEFKMLGATIDTFDERIMTSVAERVAVSKAEVLAKVTPRLDQLGRYQAKVISGIARLTRHIEDDAWFTFMLIKALR